MSLFKKIFGTVNDTSSEEEKLPVDELFTLNFKKNGGKFLYCENLPELRLLFENILLENDWFESDVACYEENLTSLLEENKLNYTNPVNTKFLLSSCEALIGNEGSILFSSTQIKQNKPQELPANIIVVATTSQIVENKSDGLRLIKKRYSKDYPTNITTIKYFDKAKKEEDLHYGGVSKNLYLLLLEDL
ncbi:MAG TPA: LUD domain-containing protein [Flavobacterium sp.]|jgi:hypothetical protein